MAFVHPVCRFVVTARTEMREDCGSPQSDWHKQAESKCPLTQASIQNNITVLILLSGRGIFFTLMWRLEVYIQYVKAKLPH